MTYNASSEHVSKIISLSAEIVVGLGTTLSFGKGRRLFRELEDALGELDVADTEPSGRHERALIKAANRAVQHFMLAGVSGELDEIADHDRKQYTIPKSLADVRDQLNFGALSKALMAFDSGEAKAVVDHLRPTIYVARHPDAHPDAVENFYTSALFINGQPVWFNVASPLSKDGAIMAAQTFFAQFNSRRIALYPEPQIIEQEIPKPYLYILMRNDLASLNAGKAVAQGTHAANQMVMEGRKFGKRDSNSHLLGAIDIWENEANGFGTCIVLAVNEKQMRDSVAKASAANTHAGICHDPTYPLMDGKTFHFIPVDTCAYVFDYPARAKRHLVGYPLMP